MTVTRQGIEVELKYRVLDAESAARLGALRTLGTLRVAGRPRQVQVEDRYIDTADGALAHRIGVDAAAVVGDRDQHVGAAVARGKMDLGGGRLAVDFQPVKLDPAAAKQLGHHVAVERQRAVHVSDPDDEMTERDVFEDSHVVSAARPGAAAPRRTATSNSAARPRVCGPSPARIPS